jgi:hypothetical protein
MSRNWNTPRILVSLICEESLRSELIAIFWWYNQHWPHLTLGGKTPSAVYEQRFPATPKPGNETTPRLAMRIALCQTGALV